jgi:hypothetical protein
MGHPFVSLKPLADATLESRTKAKKCSHSLQPYRPRPETCGKYEFIWKIDFKISGQISRGTEVSKIILLRVFVITSKIEKKWLKKAQQSYLMISLWTFFFR